MRLVKHLLSIIFLPFYLVLDKFGQDVLVEGSGEVAFKKLVIIDSLGNDSSNEFEVAKMIGVDV